MKQIKRWRRLGGFNGGQPVFLSNAEVDQINQNLDKMRNEN